MISSYPRVDIQVQQSNARLLHASIMAVLQFAQTITVENGAEAPAWIAFLTKAADHNLATVTGPPKSD